jgi:hypothetical protein
MKAPTAAATNGFIMRQHPDAIAVPFRGLVDAVRSVDLCAV